MACWLFFSSIFLSGTSRAEKEAFFSRGLLQSLAALFVQLLRPRGTAAILISDEAAHASICFVSSRNAGIQTGRESVACLGGCGTGEFAQTRDKPMSLRDLQGGRQWLMSLVSSGSV